AESRSITSVLYLKDEVSVATAGAVDSVIKFWDTRHLKGPVTQACPNSESSTEEKRLHGISSLSQDLNGVFITASCMDHRIYLYNVLQLEKGPVKTFSGGRTDSFFVKSAISPDAAHILSGSSDGNAYIWQVNKPHLDPITLKSHDGEVTAVDWCPSETGKVATCSDDFTVRFWNIESSCYSNTRSPSSMRKRVRAFPRMERRKLFSDESPCSKSGLENTNCNEFCHVSSPTPNRMVEVSTPESQKKKFSLNFEVKENLERTPEAEMTSPYSVLNPPSSLKRKTIRDYFPVS
ncbi:denticleless protein homolog, partial [Phtheirospermum japonicum]